MNSQVSAGGERGEGLRAGEWAWLKESNLTCKILDQQVLWGSAVYQVWLPTQDAILRVGAAQLESLDIPRPIVLRDDLLYVTAAARVADALERDALVAPLEATIIPLPHQIQALSRALAGDRIRYLLADEVGLGKTIEAGLILRELKMRGLVRRILVVAPAGLVTQWVQEMRSRFHEKFRAVIPGDFGAWRQVTAAQPLDNLWRLHDQVVCPLDSVKPMESRRGWSPTQLAEYNRERFEDLLAAGWDLIIIDEAHRLAGSTAEVARFKLGEGLAQASPYLLLLSATPHQGKTDAFRRLLGLLDGQAFPDDSTIRQETVAPYVIRTEKRRAVDVEGKPLFLPRLTQLEPVSWGPEHQDQQLLYETVTEYVREGYNQAVRERKNAIGFLMVLMQRLVSSSTRAIRSALERRLEVLQLPQGQLSLFPEEVGEQWAYLDGQDQMETLLRHRLQGLSNERSEVELLLSAARSCEAKGPDVKAKALLEWVQRLEWEENDPNLKVLVFTEFIPTQQMLTEFLQARGFSVVCLNGSMNLDERREVQQAFAKGSRVLVSTDAGGEGLNLQFCHVVVNYDLPWNPMKLEQRIGRVDRIGQRFVVRALNIALENSVELRIREVLEEKLARILEEMGIDKLADVLDSEEGGVDFDELYINALRSPGQAEQRASKLAEEIRKRALAAKEGTSLLGTSEPLDLSEAKRIAGQQVPAWTERMTLSFLRSRRSLGALAEPDDVGWHLRWADGTDIQRATFTRQDSDAEGATYLSLDHPRLRTLASRLPVFAPGQPITAAELPGISDRVSGLWALWRVGLQTGEGREQRVFPVFLTDDGRLLAPTARAVWDALLQVEADQLSVRPLAVTGEAASLAYERAHQAAERQGKDLFGELLVRHRNRLTSEKKKVSAAYAARRKMLSRLGLPPVRRHRLAELEREEQDWERSMAARATALPELNAVLLLRIEQAGQGA